MGADEHDQPRTAALRARLRYVYWIGGDSGAGKSTIARNLAARYGLRVYSTDDAMRDHAARSTPDDSPWLSRFAAMSMDERWVDRSAETMLETFHWFRGEGFHFIIDDLLCLSAETGVIAEGFRLLPHLVAPLLAERHCGVWLLPTPAFRRAAFDRRGWEIPGKTSNPERAARNLLERDRLFTNDLREETTRLGLPVIDVDTVSEEDLTDRVGHVLGL
ncbi:AAA family ATPase [Nocardia transvalensis]|uniref:AAA family ATPase n=1 Tax=Nocardia transvalensis TaxID=37333 RepID=UPI001894A26F|nr:AAA family ATPase [Nocardia transvalensis]MBF6334250.1 AAA family ATPase [Nocardia transvalensis]